MSARSQEYMQDEVESDAEMVHHCSGCRRPVVLAMAVIPDGCNRRKRLHCTERAAWVMKGRCRC